MLASPLASQRRAATPMAFVRAIAGAYERYGMDPSAALAQAQITPRDLADVKGRVTAAQFEALSGFAMQELDDEAGGTGHHQHHEYWPQHAVFAPATSCALVLSAAR